MGGALTEPVGSFAAGTPTLALLAAAHEFVNDAYSALAQYRAEPSSSSTTLARSSLQGATSNLGYLAARDASDEACAAARLVLPRIQRATSLLAKLGATADDAHLRPLLFEFDAAMDHLERALAGAGWE